MADASVISLIGIGFLLGLKHATDPDHLIALSTMLGTNRRWLGSCWIGVCWGVGHTLSLTVAGVLVIVVKAPISESTAVWLETAVAVMLVVLGVHAVLTPVHKHPHQHAGSATHTHWHFHAARSKQTHADWAHFAFRPLVVGLVHGAAGSAALTLMVISTISSAITATVYILIFGVGSILGMLGMSLVLSLPIAVAARNGSFVRPLRIAAGGLSCAFGVYLGVTLWLL